MTVTASRVPDIEEELARVDPALGRVITAVIARIGRQRTSPLHTAPFEALARAIVYQSISGKAAATIFARLKASIDAKFSPAKVLSMRQDSMRAAGLSKSKTGAIRSLAEWFVANPKMAKTLPGLPDNEVVAALTGIAGVGAWTVNVFLIFNLGRLDVMPASDLGIRRGVQLVYGLKKIATPKEVYKKAQLWRPYRSIASIYLWNAVKLKIGSSGLK